MACVPVDPDEQPTAGLSSEASAAGTVLVVLDGTDHAHVLLRGEMDLASADDADAACALVETLGCAVVVDASRVTFLDATALGFLVRLRRVSEGWWVQQVSTPVLRLLEITDSTWLLAAAARRDQPLG